MQILKTIRTGCLLLVAGLAKIAMRSTSARYAGVAGSASTHEDTSVADHYFGLTTNNLIISFDATVPIVGW